MSKKEYTGADDVQAKIASYKDDFRGDAKKLHDAIMNAGVTLHPRLWYGMPGYAKTETGAVIIYFRKDIYITFGKTQFAHMDFDDKDHAAEVAYCFTKINDTSLAKVQAVVRSAAES